MGTKLGPALAAGNTIIVKPASTTPLATLLCIEQIQKATYGEGRQQRSLPKGAVNVVTGPGSTVGEELLRNHYRASLIVGGFERPRAVF